MVRSRTHRQPTTQTHESSVSAQDAGELLHRFGLRSRYDALGRRRAAADIAGQRLIDLERAQIRSELWGWAKTL
jgi:hypothetical protein